MTDEEMKKRRFKSFLKQANGDAKKIARMDEVYDLCHDEFTKIGTIELGFSCDRGEIQCPDGSCVPAGTLCP